MPIKISKELAQKESLKDQDQFTLFKNQILYSLNQKLSMKISDKFAFNCIPFNNYKFIPYKVEIYFFIKISFI